MNEAAGNADLIFDLGANHGEDTEFYLSKGFRVVSLEANPDLVSRLQHKFSAAMAAKQCYVVGYAISDRSGENVEFFVNETNDHWSSLKAEWGTRQNTDYRTVPVPTITLHNLLHDFGCPYYMKIDIEGADDLVIRQLAQVQHRPTYVSFEEHGVDAIDLLHTIGYTHFQLVDQSRNGLIINPRPALEGQPSDFAHSGRSSGLFGRELPNAWLNHTRFRDFYLQEIRNEKGVGCHSDSNAWFDVHATRKAARIPEPEMASQEIC